MTATFQRAVHLNGNIVPEEAARISPFDRGFLLGDGVFETMRAYGGRPFCLDAHLERLRSGGAIARLAVPDDLPQRIQETLAANGLADAAVRVTLTRGPGGAGASPRGAGPPTVLVTATPIPYPESTYTQGVRLATSRRRRVPAEALETGVKSTNYLVHVLARLEAEEAGADDALFVDADDNAVEATQSNVFAIVEGTLVTPPLASGCLPGVARATILDVARHMDVAVMERALPRRDLARATEVFLTASILEVASVVALDGMPIATGRPGPIAGRMRAAYRARAMAPG